MPRSTRVIQIVGDIHAPVSHPGYLQFNKDLYREWGVTDVVLIGDVVDLHSVSFHAHHPDAPGPKDEFELAYQEVQKWYTAFPKARVCIGNHDARLVRLAETVNIPSKYLRNYSEIWDTPGWDWKHEHQIDGIHFFHGTGQGGLHPAYNAAKKMLMSVVMGHVHSAAGIKWLANPNHRIFAMDVGCGVDDRAVAFAYGKHNLTRSVLGSGIIWHGIPYHEIMPIGPGEKYHRDRFAKGESR